MARYRCDWYVYNIGSVESIRTDIKRETFSTVQIESKLRCKSYSARQSMYEKPPYTVLEKVKISLGESSQECNLTYFFKNQSSANGLL